MLLLLLALLMVSNVKYPKFPPIGVRSARGIFGLVVHLVILFGGLLFPEYFLFPLGLFYMMFGLARTTVLGLMERPEPMGVIDERVADGDDPTLPPPLPTSVASAGATDAGSRSCDVSNTRAGHAPQRTAGSSGSSRGTRPERAGILKRREQYGLGVPSSSTWQAGSRDEAEATARLMCDKLLANPVTEDYLVNVEED